MLNFSKKYLFTMAMVSVMTLVGCSNTNRLIVPDGSKRVPVNHDASPYSASTR